MIRSFAIAAAACALAVPVSAAAADPVFDAFRSICVSTSDDYVAVLKAADSAGWKETAVVPPADPAISITDQGAREILQHARPRLIPCDTLANDRDIDLRQQINISA